MAGGGVGEAMLIGAAMGAGTGAVTSAIDKKDPLQGALMGAVGGAAMGGLGSAVGGAATTAAEQVGQSAVQQGVQQGAEQAAIQSMGQQGAAQATQAMSQMPTLAANNAATASMAEGATQIPMQSAAQAPQSGGIANWMGAGKGEGFAPGLTNAQAYGAAGAGGISGISAAQNLPQNEPFPTEEESYSGPLSYFKYDPTKYKVDQPTPVVYQSRFADGGIASLGASSPINNPIYPQSQQQQTTFATSPQMPNSMRSAMASDYDTRTNPSFGTELPMGFADGGGIGFIRGLQPGGAWGDMTSDLYGVVQEHKPGWLKDMEPGGFIGATVPGKMDWEDKQRAKQEEEEARKREEAARAATIARNTSMQQGMASGGIASLGGYSDGGRLLKGPGDGVSDSIPASIGGRQPARLADGEFVVPSRIVSELGNGSTDAGARRLYDMMDRVQARRSKTVGKGKVAKNTRAYQELPA